ncbi:UDP-N-acetylmuramoyl-L-alanine--D-glutamate ligase [Dokdonella sp.]|uniref:UDP-N-acetylmuramoyl-L-alanine--D-glutamate ligase n=1 Tax=Dokdonella sp. TaxID=2291710 RepID=UPI003C5AC952
MRIADLAGLRVAIWGLGREGHAAYKVLRQRLPKLMLTIFCGDAEAEFLMVGNALDRFITTPPTAADLSAFDLVIKSPGIGGYRPELLDAQRNGTRFSSATALWFAEHAGARVIGVTGTKGKSTTSALIAHLLRGIGRRTALAGNIGLPVLELLDPSQEPDWWVLELSSFQTRQVDHLTLGVITNIEEEHLDWHGSRERYVSDKLAMAVVSDTLLVNANQVDLLRRTNRHPRRELFGNTEGWHLDAEQIRRGGQAVFERSRLPLPGWHNAMNACAALAALETLGEDAMAAAQHLVTFTPLPHRLQTLGERESRIWIDDSIATTPQATIEALRSQPDREVCVIVGGHERGLDWQVFADYALSKPPHLIIANGANAARIGHLLRATNPDCRVEVCVDLSAAVACARKQTPAGGVIMLSPGAPSFDQFHDYAERGRCFAELAGFDPEAIGQIEGLGIA